MRTLAAMEGPSVCQIDRPARGAYCRSMQRRDFLKVVGAASIAPGTPIGAAPPSPAATVLYDDRAVALDRVGPDPKHDGAALWIRKHDLERVNGFALKPQGACRADLCIPIPKDMVRGE